MFRSKRNYVVAAAQSSQLFSGCRHHWIIEKATGSTSTGECNLCGEKKDFRNFSGDLYWKRETLPETSLNISARIAEEEPN